MDEEGTCALYGDLIENCDSFEFDTGINDESVECAELRRSE